ncbi:LysR family transcriptional regulator [Cognatishimia sp. D5M38]|uniref:LysR family transcriptional regulator n=1 Tax=Cognatishimia coralii TaxID=3083254 RepID=A0ABU8QLA7_9RHOB|nr:LysR family transcriptional regulator [Donghicola eburneus]MCI5039360.1 LysR family transcriptional regulator [Donghicola eburneus]
MVAGPNQTNFSDLKLFLTIARRHSFTSAAIECGITPSAASHAIRRLEEKLGVELLNRTSRSVMPTDLGAELARSLAGGFDKIDEALNSIGAPGAARFGELRINTFADAAHLLLSPALPEFAKRFPDIRLTVAVEERPIDIVAEGYDAGVRYGHHVPEDMVAVALTGPHRWVVVAAPHYLETHGPPQRPEDLQDHVCIQLQLGDSSSYAWELHDGDGDRAWQVPGNITIKDTATTISAAKAGVGLAYLLEARIKDELADGSLKIVLDSYASSGEPLHIYYGSRRHNHPGLRALTNIVRQQNGLGSI